MKNAILSFFVGLLFALGLGVAGMTDPRKVIGFLDLFGEWNPSLLFVMVGAITIHAPSYYFIRKRAKPLLSEIFQVPTKKEIDRRLVGGALIFGLGWGLIGYCPAPAITSLATGELIPFVFIAAMVSGMLVCRIF